MQRKRTKQSRAANKMEKDFQAWLKEQPCCVSGEWGVQVHHCKGSSCKRNKRLIGHLFCIPLSVTKHAEYHAGTKAFKQKYGLQSELCLSLIEQFENETGVKFPDEDKQAIKDSRE